jgi:TRAP-type C4-dicarboxylate transport system permease small subunit
VSEGEDAPQPEQPAPKGVAGLLTAASFWAGAVALLLAMMFDSIAVVGRHIDVPLLGSIELVQACVVVVASAAMVSATLDGAHASVHILLERVKAGARAVFQRIADLASALFFVILIVGSVWLVLDLRGAHERTEVLHLPMDVLRIIWCASAALVCALFIGRFVFGGPRNEEHGE